MGDRIQKDSIVETVAIVPPRLGGEGRLGAGGGRSELMERCERVRKSRGGKAKTG